MHADDVSARIDVYVSEFRKSLADTPAEEKEDLLQEIRSHIAERVESYGEITEDLLNRILQSVGNPRQLASQYKTDAMLRRAAKSRSPWVLLRTTFRWATTGIAGVIALFITVLGYGIATSSVLCFLLKPFFPSRIGLWLSPQHAVTLGYWNGQFVGTEVYGFSFRPPFDFVVLGTLGSTNGPIREMLGAWLYPVCLLAALLFLVATTYFVRWFIRRFGTQRSPSFRSVGKTPYLHSTLAGKR